MSPARGPRYESSLTVCSVNATRYRCQVTVVTPRGRKLVMLSSGDGLTRPGMWDAVSACQVGADSRRRGDGGARREGSAAETAAADIADRGIRAEFSGHRVVIGGGLGR